MNNKNVVSHKQKLDAIFKKVEELEADPELIAHWSRYLCVLVSGFIEASVRTLITNYASARSSPEIAHFVGRRLKMFTNAKMNKIYDLVSEFGESHKEKLETSIDQEISDAVDSIVSNRHQIAHGQDVGIGFATIKRYYESAVKAIEQIEKQLDPKPPQHPQGQ